MSVHFELKANIESAEVNVGHLDKIVHVGEAGITTADDGLIAELDANSAFKRAEKSAPTAAKAEGAKS